MASDSGRLELAAAILAAFRGRDGFVARGTDRGTFEPVTLKVPIKPEWLAERHLAQQRCLGFYLCDQNSRVWCSCADFDNKPEHPDPEWKFKAETVHLWLQGAGLGPVVEVSQSGTAAHVWLFFDEPTDAWLVRAWWRGVADKTGVAIREVYPRQDQLTGKGLGNLVRYPLWNQSRFVDPENDWATVEPLEAMKVRRCCGADLKSLAFDLGVGELKPGESRPAVAVTPLADAANTDADDELPARVAARLKRGNSLLARRWSGDRSGLKDTSTSALVMSIACELVRQYVPTAEVAASVRYWCLANDYEKGATDRAVSRAVSAAYEYLVMRTEEKSAGATQMRDACHAYLDTLAAGTPTYIPSGVPALDQSMDGVGYGEMCVIAGRPSHCKSALALQWLDQAAAAKVPCLIISEEMSAVELGKRVVCRVSPLEQEHWSPDVVPELRQFVDLHYRDRAPIYLVESCNSIERAETVIDQFCGLHGVRLVAVDYLQLLGSKRQKRYEEITDVSVRLKQAAKRNGCAMLAVCQVNRNVEGRQNYEPQNSDLRDAGQIEQDADLIIHVQWPYKFDTSFPRDEYKMFVKKRRNGPIRQVVVNTTFDPERQRIGAFQRNVDVPPDRHMVVKDDGEIVG